MPVGGKTGTSVWPASGCTLWPALTSVTALQITKSWSPVIPTCLMIVPSCQLRRPVKKTARFCTWGLVHYSGNCKKEPPIPGDQKDNREFCVNCMHSITDCLSQKETKKQKVEWIKMCCMHVEKENPLQIQYRYSHNTLEVWETLDLRRWCQRCLSDVSRVTVTPLYSGLRLACKEAAGPTSAAQLHSSCPSKKFHKLDSTPDECSELSEEEESRKRRRKMQSSKLLCVPTVFSLYKLHDLTTTSKLCLSLLSTWPYDHLQAKFIITGGQKPYWHYKACLEFNSLYTKAL